MLFNPRTHNPTRGHSKSPLNFPVWFPLGHFELLMSRVSQARSRVTILAEKVMVTMAVDPSNVRVWVLPLAKPPRLAEMLAGGEGI